MIDRVWTERFPVASLFVSTRPGGGTLFRLGAGIERLRETIRVNRAPLRRAIQDLRTSLAKVTPEKNSDRRPMIRVS